MVKITYTWICPHCSAPRGGTEPGKYVDHDFERLTVPFEKKICTLTLRPYYIVYNRIDFLTHKMEENLPVVIANIVDLAEA